MDSNIMSSPSLSRSQSQRRSGNHFVVVNGTAQPRELIFKVIVIGDPAVGKTSTIRRYVDNVFSNKYRYTIGVDFAVKILEWEDNSFVRLQLWDIAGQDRFGVMTHVYFKEANGVVVVFSLTSRKTLEGAVRWKQEVDAKLNPNGDTPVPAILLANKSDAQAHREVSNEEIDEVSKVNGFLSWFETSAKDDSNINEAMNTLTACMIPNYKEPGTGKIDSGIIQIEASPTGEQAKPKCC